MIHNFQSLVPDQSIIGIDVNHNIIRFAQLIDEEVHVCKCAQMLSRMDQFQSVIQPVSLLLQILCQALCLLLRRVIIHVDHMEVCVVLTLQGSEELFISVL